MAEQWHNIFAAFFLFGLGLVHGEAGNNVKAQIGRLKSASTVEEWTSGFKKLGVPEDSIKHLMFNHLPPEEERGMQVVRAEAFLEDLDGDGRKESVSQVVFENDPENGKSGLDYAFMIHADPESSPKLLLYRTVGLMKCGYVGASGMRFTFVKSRSGKGKRVLLKITKVSRCDVDGQEYIQRSDTLALKSGVWTYLEDAAPKTISRKGDPEGP